MAEPLPKVGLMGHVIADYPSSAEVRRMIAVMAAEGVAVIEIQIPFSEPMADGPTFLAANHQALAQGVDYAASLLLLREAATAHPKVQFYLMTYVNVVYKRGWQRFAAEAKASGAVGVILPDLPFELAFAFDEACAASKFANVPLIPPNCAGARLDALCRRAPLSTDLIYAVARAGVTGAASAFGQNLAPFLRSIRERSPARLALGFGVKLPEHVKALRGLADFAVVGTAALEAHARGGLAAYTSFWRGLAAAAKAPA